MTERILFVDDEPDMEELIRQRLRKHVREEKFILEFAGNGRLALEKLKVYSDIRIIVTDINMPEMDGLTLLSELSKLDRPTRTLVVSAYGDMQNIRSAMNNGAFDFVTKPIDFIDLDLTLEKTVQEVLYLLQSLDTKQKLQDETIERIKAQEEALKQAEENAKLIIQQNIMLEEKVAERTLELAEKNEILNVELQRSEQLLLNILPYETAQELKMSGKAVARYYPDITVMFTDFKGFTHIAEKLSPEQLVQEIDEFFTAFDLIMEKNGIEKIKTIGDAYMAASGLPAINDTHALDMVNAAVDIIEYMEVQKQIRISEGRPVFDIRIGIHTGPVVAGIVGHKKFAYDIWGDAVNLASRMESSGEAGQINISQCTYDRISSNYSCIFRGEIEAKNKGKVGMYFVNIPSK
jgi:class 3 adenylate cyclase/DNA-binding NarL/FixJ family response regulator